MATVPLRSTEYTPRKNYNTSRKSPLLWVLTHLRRHILYFILVVTFTFTIAIIQSSIPRYISAILSLYNDGKLTRDMLEQNSLIILILGVSAGVITLLRNFTTEFISQRLEKDTRDELYSSLLGKSLTFHDRQKIGDLMTRATGDVRMINFMFNPGFNLVFQSIVSIIVPIAVMGLINPNLLLVPVIYVIVFVIVLRRYNQNQSPYAMKTRRASSITQARLNEVITGMHVVRSSAEEEKEKEIFDKNISMYKEAQIKLGEIQAKYWPLLIFGIATAASIYHGVILVQSGVITVEQFIQFILLFQILRFPTFINVFAITVLTMGYSAATRILEVLEGDSEIDLNTEGYAKEIKGHIEFRNVTFAYGDGQPVLKDINFEVQPGQTVALVGMTGSGKTTITKLIARLYDPQEGEILVDGVNLKDWSIEALRNQMAVVEQDVFLFSKSIKDNILLGKPDATFEEIVAAAKLAQAHDFIMKTPDQYDTVIGERGMTLSGGQKQRLAIARAVIKDPKILILDDASSAIDSKTEDEINTAIKDVLKGRVSFLITHRIAQIIRADLIILLEQGKIVDMGNHEYLITNSVKYRELFSIYDDFDTILPKAKEVN